MSKPVWVLPSLFLFIAAIVTVASAQQNDAPVKHAAPIQRVTPVAPIVTANDDPTANPVVIGRVDTIDHETGWVKIVSEDRELRLRYPFHKIKDIKMGDNVKVRLASSSEQTIEKFYPRKTPFNLQTWLAMYNLEETGYEH